MIKCKLPLCDREEWLTGLCHAHYHRKMRHGDSFDKSPIRRDNMVWEDLVEKFTMPIPESGCLIWMGAISGVGYGIARLNGRYVSTHRTSYEKEFGEIPKGLFVLHRCDVRACMNPKHLFLGSAQDNTTDMIKKGRNKQPRGEKAGRAKLQQHQVLEIRASNLSASKIAAMYGIGKSSVIAIRNRRSWSHIP